MTMKSTDRPVIGVDLGGTKILAGVVDSNGALLGQSKRPTKPSAGVDAVIDRMAKTVREAIEVAGLKLSDMAGLGTGAPGPLDPDEGVVLHTPNLPWVNVPLAKMLSERLDDLPVFIENDVNLGTYGECAFGAGKGAQDVVGIFVGTGLGGGLVLGGELRQGWRKACAEVGHMILLADGPVCGCGKRGCAEALASRTAIERDIWAGIKAGRESVIPDLVKQESRERLTSGALAEAFRRGDPLVAEVLGKAQFYLGLLTASVVNFVDPEMVILGGGVVEALGESFLVPIRAVAYQFFINQDGAKDVTIVPAMLGDNAALMGAAAWARMKLAKA
jgi:glucokinase